MLYVKNGLNVMNVVTPKEGVLHWCDDRKCIERDSERLS